MANPLYIRFAAGRFVFRGSSTAETVLARGGNYRKLVVQGAAGDDALSVTTGPHSAKALVCGPGDDVLTGSDNADHLDGNAGVDRIDGRGGVDVCIGEHVVDCER